MKNADKPASEMTKREAFAMAAMQGMLGSNWGATIPEVIATDSLQIADAMLAALEEKEATNE